MLSGCFSAVRSKLLAARDDGHGPAKPHGGVRVWRGRAPAGAPATSLNRAGVGRARRCPSSRYGGRVEPNPSRQESGDAARQPADQVNDVDASASWAAEDASERRHRRRRTLLVVASFLLVICLVGGVVGYVLYDRSTRIDLGTPVVVVVQYVDAVFDRRDPTEAELFECKRSNGRPALQDLLSEIEERERRFGIRISVSTGETFNTTIEGTRAHVVVDLIIAAPEPNGERSRASQSWEFDLRDEDGWRVCDARQAQ
jgi:hypothetical protein